MWEVIFRNNVWTVIRQYRCRDVNKDDFEIDTGLRDELQGVKQEDPVLKDEGKLAAQERPTGNLRGRAGRRTLVPQANPVADPEICKGGFYLRTQ